MGGEGKRGKISRRHETLTKTRCTGEKGKEEEKQWRRRRKRRKKNAKMRM